MCRSERGSVTKSCVAIANYDSNESYKPQKLMIFLFLGFLIAFLGAIILIVTAFFMESSTSIGIVIFIGPIPIIIGAGPQAEWLIVFAIILTVLGLIMFAVMRRQRNKNVG